MDYWAEHPLVWRKKAFGLSAMESKELKRVNTRWIFLGQRKADFLRPALLVVIMALMQSVLLTFVARQVVDAVVLGKLSLLWPWACALAGVLLAYTFVALIYKRSRFLCIQRITFDAEDAVLDQCRDLQYWRDLPAAEVLGYLKDTAGRASGGTIDFLLETISALIVIIGTSVYTFMLNLHIFVIVAIFMVVMMIFMQKDARKLPKLYETFYEHTRELDKKLWEQIKNHEIASLLNLHEVQKGYRTRNEQFTKDLKKIKKIDNKASLTKKYGPLFLMIIVVVFGGWGHANGGVSLSAIYAMVIMIPSLAGALAGLPSLLARGKECEAAMTVMSDFLSLRKVSAKQGMGLERIDSVAFENVSVRYRGENSPALQDLSFSLQAGMTALVGPSGSGKSTALLLMMRLLPPTNGKVLVNNQTIEQYDRAQLFKQIAYCGQTPRILPTSIRWNITLSDACDEARLHALLEELSLTEWIAGLKDQLDTRIDENSLSSGEKQKICLARCLYKKESLLILDEATSAMDPIAEQTMLAALKRRSRAAGLIVVFSTHSKQVIEGCDQIFCLEGERGMAQ